MSLHDTYGIAARWQKSIPLVSDTDAPGLYHCKMPKNTWKTWGPRFKKLAKENGHTLASLAEKLGRSESTLRSWTNGTREINFSEFFDLCAAAGVNPSMVIFGALPMNAEARQHVAEAITRALGSNLPPFNS